MLEIVRRLIKREDYRIIDAIRKGAIFIDVRTSKEFAGNGLGETVNIPLDDLFQEMNHLEKNVPVVVFCRSGNRIRHARFMLLENGFVQVEEARSIEQMKQLLIKAKEKWRN